MPGALLFEDFEVIPRLTELGLPKDIVLDILDMAAGERARVTPSDPAATAGNEMRRWLIRYLRDDPRLKKIGWVACSHGQLEGIRNDALKIKLVPLNTDANAGVLNKEPISVSEKGPAAEKVIKGNEDRRQGNMFEEPEDAPDPLADYDFLYFCTHASDIILSAEISRPSGLFKSHIAHYSERIILSQPGERPGLRRPNPVEEDFAKIETPTIIRNG